jgi:hypothetical protein
MCLDVFRLLIYVCILKEPASKARTYNPSNLMISHLVILVEFVMFIVNILLNMLELL